MFAITRKTNTLWEPSKKNIHMSHHSLQNIKNHSCIVLDGTETVQIHLSTRIENLWKILYWGFILLLGPTLYFYFFKTNDRLAIVCAEVFLIGLGLFLKKNTDNYYVLDLKSKILFFHRHFFRTKMIAIAKLNQIQAVAVTGRFEFGEFGSHWFYHVVIVLPNRKVLRLTDKSTDLKTTNLLAKDLSSLMGGLLYQGKEKMAAVINHNDSSSNIIEFQRGGIFVPFLRFSRDGLLLAGFVYLFFKIFLI